MKGRAIVYEPEELAWIEAHKELPRAAAYTLFCARFMRQDVSLSNFKALCKRNGWLTGRTGQFVPGQVSHNKGKPMPDHVRAKVMATTFKPGSRPHTWRGPGHESIDPKDGYVWIIVAETNPHTGADTRRVMKHRYLWEQENGPIPAGHALKCLDGERTNTDPSNWEAVPRAMLPRLNGRFGRNYDSAPADLKPAIMATAKLEHRAREVRKGKA